MITSFKEYKTLRENTEFEQKFHYLCETIVRSGVRFEDYWSQLAVPTINESYSYSNEEELLNELFGLFGGKKKQAAPEAPLDWSNLPGNAPAPAPAPAPMPGTGTYSTNDPKVMADYQGMQKAAKEKQRAEQIAKYQSRIDSQIDTVKQRFATAMKDFLRVMTGDAKQQSDPHMWKIAQSFYKKIMSAAQPVADEFKMKLVDRKASYVDNFARVSGPHQQQTQDFYGNLGKSVQGTAAPTPAAAPASPASAMGGSQPTAQTSSGPTLGRDSKTGRITSLKPKTV
jgi:hypothetical protein